MTFNTRREAKRVAETDYRRFGAIACLNGKILCLLWLTKPIEYLLTTCGIFIHFKVLFILLVDTPTLTTKTAFPTKL